MSVPESRQGPRSKMDQPENKVDTSVRQVTNNDYEELPPPEEAKPAKPILKSTA